MKNLLILTLLIFSKSFAGTESKDFSHQGAALNPDRFNSPQCKHQNHHKKSEKIDPAFYGLMAHLCGWRLPLLPSEPGKFKSMWSKIAGGEDVSTYDIEDFEALIKAKDKYDALSQKDEASFPILPFQPSDLLYSMIDSGKLNLLKEKQLRFYLKLYDCKLVDADADAISGNAFAQLFNLNEEGVASGLHQNASEILSRVMGLEKKFWSKKKEAASKACTDDFTQSPMQLFAKAVSARIKEEVNIYPRTRIAPALAAAMRNLQGELHKVKDPALMNQMAQSLSAAVTEIEKSSPRR